MDEDVQVTEDDQIQFLESILSNLPEDNFVIEKSLVNKISNSLKFNSLMKINVPGNDLSHRFDDNGVIKLAEGLVAAAIILDEIALPFHNISGKKHSILILNKKITIKILVFFNIDTGLEELLRLLHQSQVVENGYAKRALTTLNVEGNNIEGNLLINSILMSPYDSPLKTFNLSSNALSSKGQIAIADILQCNRTLSHLSINACGFTLPNIIAITASLYENPSLETLFIDRPLVNNYKQHEHLDHMSRLLEQHRTLRSLSLKQHLAVDHDITLLANALYHPQNRLIHMNLECNSIGVAGAEALASNIVYKGMTSLKFLGLSYNCISDDGAIAFAFALKANTGLKVLTLKNNRIGPIGLTAIANALETASNIETLTLFGNSFSNDNGKQYQRLLQQRLKYTQVNLDIDIYVVDGQYQVAEVAL
jgi:Ran GTPase-activating protein (RanGAP) involved in mRNA processing and transport